MSSATTMTAAHVVMGEDELRQVASRASAARRVAIDLEASGMFTYRARLCTVQLAWDASAVSVIDTMAVSVEPLARLLSDGGPLKIVHDVAFDARLLAEHGIELGHVHDTALAAMMLGREATGLAALLERDLGITVDKHMQRHDWRQRPLDDKMLAYLAQDVVFLFALHDKIWAEVSARGIVDEVLEETQYRLSSALRAVRSPDATPPYMKVKGADRLAEHELAALRVLAQLRDSEAIARDVPPHRVLSSDTLLALAKARPPTPAQVLGTRGISRDDPEAPALAEKVVRALEGAGDSLPCEERAQFERPPPPAAEIRARRERQLRLLAWRRNEAKRRGVDEQVVLPGHCVKDATDEKLVSVEDLLRVPGIGSFRVERDGEAIARALQGAEGDGALP